MVIKNDIKKKTKILVLILGIFLFCNFVSAIGFDNPNLPGIKKIIDYIKNGGDDINGTYNFNGGWTSGGLSIIGGSIYAQVGHFLNITYLNITRQNLTITDNLVVGGNVTVENVFGKFGDLISEQNSYFGNAIRLKGTGDDVDIVLGDSTGYFSIWDVADTAPVFSIDNQGDIVTTGGAIFNENSADRTFRVESNGNEYMLFVDGNDRVGIGTANPSEKLEVNGNILLSALTGSRSNQLMFEDTGATEWFVEYLTNGLNFAEAGIADYRLFLQDGGNVGIGTSTPQQKLNVIGNGNFTGNVTAENVFLPSFLFAHLNKTIPVASAGDWYNITFDEEEADPKRRITHTYNDITNDTFTIIDDGYYNIHYAMSFSSSNAAPTSHIIMRVIKNGLEIGGSLLEEDATKQYSDFTISNGPIVYLVTGDEIVFQFTSDDTDVSLTSHRSYGDHHDTAIIKIIRIA